MRWSQCRLLRFATSFLYPRKRLLLFLDVFVFLYRHDLTFSFHKILSLSHIQRPYLLSSLEPGLFYDAKPGGTVVPFLLDRKPTSWYSSPNFVPIPFNKGSSTTKTFFVVSAMVWWTSLQGSSRCLLLQFELFLVHMLLSLCDNICYCASYSGWIQAMKNLSQRSGCHTRHRLILQLGFQTFWVYIWALRLIRSQPAKPRTRFHMLKSQLCSTSCCTIQLGIYSNRSRFLFENVSSQDSQHDPNPQKLSSWHCFPSAQAYSVESLPLRPHRNQPN